MSPSQPPLPPELHTLLQRESTIPPLPLLVRTRAVARARAAMAMGDAVPVMLRRPRAQLGALTAAVATAAAAGAIGYELGGRYERAIARSETTTKVVARERPAYVRVPAAAVVPFSAPSATGPDLRDSQPTSEADEVLLLGKARSAVAARDFAGALAPISEHARRFERGVLAEEREALRIGALTGLHRTEEARHAAAAFEARFPHSVLLRAVREMAPEPRRR